MSKRLKYDIKVNSKDFQYSSKHTDTTLSDSSIKNVTLVDNGMLTNKKIYIHYGKENPDFRLEFALKRLNAVIVQFYDDVVNYVITTVHKKRLSKTGIPSSKPGAIISNHPVMGSRARKLIDLVQQKTVSSPKPISITDKDNVFLDHVAEKGIRILHIKSVWSWLREHHSLILEDDDDNYDVDNEGNETRDVNNEVRKLTEPSLKIVDFSHQTRPNFHQKCLFPQHMFEETVEKIVCDKSDTSCDTAQLKPTDVMKDSQKKRLKASKMMQKSDLAFCECCNENYSNLLSHLKSPGHLEFANNVENFKGIDTVISTLQQLSTFISIRLRKQTILKERKTNTKLIKSLSANDFKKEKQHLSRKQEYERDRTLKKSMSVMTKGTLPLLCCEVLEVTESFDTVTLIEYDENVYLTGEDCVTFVSVEWNKVMCVHQQLSVVPEHCWHVEEDEVEVVDDLERGVEAEVVIEMNVLSMAEVSQPESVCQNEWMKYPEEIAREFTVDIERLPIKEDDSREANGISVITSVLKMSRKEPMKTVFLVPKCFSETNEEFAIEISSDDKDDTIHYLRPALTPNNGRSLDPIVDLRKFGAQPTISLSKLPKSKPFSGIDNFVSSHFRSRFGIDLVAGAVSTEVPSESDVRRRGVRTQGSVIHTDDVSSQSPGRPYRRAKTVARDSISLTTQMYLN